MIETSRVQREVGPAACRDCDWDDLPRLRFYLVVWRQARLYREPFAEVLRCHTRESRLIDPGVRGKTFDMEAARAIGWALDAVHRQRGAAFMHPDNCEAVADVLCPSRAR